MLGLFVAHFKLVSFYKVHKVGKIQFELSKGNSSEMHQYFTPNLLVLILLEVVSSRDTSGFEKVSIVLSDVTIYIKIFCWFSSKNKNSLFIVMTFVFNQ
jgi:hypothetical protein